MKVLISDSLSQSGLDLLYNQPNIITDLKPELSPDELITLIGDYDALIIRSRTQVTKAVIEAANNLKVIGRAGVGVDNIDVSSATQKGILVFNTPAGNTIAAAEHTIALMLSLSRHILPAGISLRNQEWSRGKFMGSELYGKTFGVIGVGRIGSEVIRRLQAFDMKLLAYDPYISVQAADRLGIKLVDRNTLIQTADYISIHVPLTPETHHSISTDEFALMKSNCRLVNCARGGIIDESALYIALKDQQIAGAALDVFEHEPPADHRLMELDNFLSTPHLGASTTEAQNMVAIEVAQKVVDSLHQLPIENAVNQPNMEKFDILQPYLRLAERIGSFQSQIVEGQISGIRIRYNGEIFNQDVTLVSVAVQAGLLRPILQGNVNYVSAPLEIKQRGISISETKHSTPNQFTNSLAVTVVTNQGERIIEGTVLTSDDIRLVSIDDIHLHAEPEGHMIVIYNRDQPGMIGMIGTMLGDYGINIADMAVGRKDEADHALMLINVDSKVPRHVVEKIKSLPTIMFVKQVKF